MTAVIAALPDRRSGSSDNERSSENEQRTLEQVYAELDEDGNGVVTTDELRKWVPTAGANTDADLNQCDLIRAAQNNNGTLDYHDFLQVWRETKITRILRELDGIGAGISGFPAASALINQLFGVPEIGLINFDELERWGPSTLAKKRSGPPWGG